VERDCTFASPYPPTPYSLFPYHSKCLPSIPSLGREVQVIGDNISLDTLLKPGKTSYA